MAFRRTLSGNMSLVAFKKMETTSSSPFTKVVIEAMRKLYPEKLADSSFDNTGLLLEAPHRPGLKNSVLLTVDLTKAVADEAIARKDSVIVTYHPIIFKPLKTMTLANTQQSSLLRLAQEGISVYSPHTAVDAAVGGLTEWLADIVTRLVIPDRSRSFIRNEISVITPVIGFKDAGYGRIVRFEEPQKLGSLLDSIMDGLGSLQTVSLAVPQSVQGVDKAEIPISSIGICAGSGGSTLNGIEVDMLFTGELSHHEALAAIEQGRVVVTTFHSNTERAFLKDCMQHNLSEQIKQDLTCMPPNSRESMNNYEVVVSQVDRDPFETVIRPAAANILLNIKKL